MKAIIRAIVFSFISLYVTQEYIRGIDFGNDRLSNEAFLILGLAAINFLVIPALKVLGFKVKGLGALVIRFLLIGIMFYLLIPSIPGLKFIETTLSELIIYNFVLPSKSLNPLLSLVSTALMFSALYSFLDWLCPKKG